MIKKMFGVSFAVMMIGEGVMCVLTPTQYVSIWKRGPQAWQSVVEPLAQNPNATRVIGAVEVALGLWLALREEDGD